MTKTLKPVLALSVAALTLLAGCAKGDASTAYSKAKKDVNASLKVKSWNKACYSHSDVAKYLKSDDASSLSEDAKADLKAKGNSVTVVYTFTTKDGKEYLGTAVYTTKDKKLSNTYGEVPTVTIGVTVSADSLYQTARSALDLGDKAPSYYSWGDLKK